ncbi:RNA polymerase sigma factor [Myxococcus sp. K15C18031901]|uniref:RNA polymerase sigma factor n=1 Tax=Myxococcus dinghuensis TaxID=2906761 RepID=UPI0020A7409B|nr:RNA polymerase sigma factor [Myxococcus dinghuensis]MCP3097813.1 RNA polymerase sigma factor [Myxococcus dinghuensis]
MGAGHGALLTAAARGDDEALAVLVRTYHDRVYRFGLRVCRDGDDADDAVQEAFVKLARRPEVQRDAGVLAWLMSVVRNACLRMLRPFARERQPLGERLGEDEVPAADALDPQQVLERWELVQVVHAAIAGLDPIYREVLILRDLEGLSGEEASRALGLELTTLKTRLHRARTRLREALLRRDVRSGRG